MAKKMLTGKVVSDKMNKTVVVEIERLIEHPMYKKTFRRTTRIKADTNSFEVAVGQSVKIEGVRPLSRDKHFRIIEVIKKGE